MYSFGKGLSLWNICIYLLEFELFRISFDISVFLVNKNSEYMKFKEEIKHKSQIRQLIGDVPNSVIELFERWWDKYGTSLARIDSEFKESEAVLHKFLKELGYE